MIPQTILSALLIAGITLIWRVARGYPFTQKHLSKISPFFKKQLSCSTCVLYWISIVFSIFFAPLRNWLPYTRSTYLWGEDVLLPFLFQSMIIGTIASIIYFTIVILIEGGNFLTEASHRKSNSSIS